MMSAGVRLKEADGDVGSFERNQFVTQRRAWEWARANALVWTPMMQREDEGRMRAYETDDADLLA